MKSPSCCEDCKCGESCPGCPSYAGRGSYVSSRGRRAMRRMPSARIVMGADDPWATSPGTVTTPSDTSTDSIGSAISSLFGSIGAGAGSVAGSVAAGTAGAAQGQGSVVSAGSPSAITSILGSAAKVFAGGILGAQQAGILSAQQKLLLAQQQARAKQMQMLVIGGIALVGAVMLLKDR